MRVSGFFRCSCGKLHAYGGLSFTTKCSCGVKLYSYAFHKPTEK